MSLIREVFATYGSIVYTDDKYIVCRATSWKYFLLDVNNGRPVYSWYTDTVIADFMEVEDYAAAYVEHEVPLLDLV